MYIYIMHEIIIKCVRTQYNVTYPCIYIYIYISQNTGIDQNLKKTKLKPSNSNPTPCQSIFLDFVYEA